MPAYGRIIVKYRECPYTHIISSFLSFRCSVLYLCSSTNAFRPDFVAASNRETRSGGSTVFDWPQSICRSSSNLTRKIVSPLVLSLLRFANKSHPYACAWGMLSSQTEQTNDENRIAYQRFPDFTEIIRKTQSRPRAITNTKGNLDKCTLATLISARRLKYSVHSVSAKGKFSAPRASAPLNRLTSWTNSGNSSNRPERSSEAWAEEREWTKRHHRVTSREHTCADTTNDEAHLHSPVEQCTFERKSIAISCSTVARSYPGETPENGFNRITECNLRGHD